MTRELMQRELSIDLPSGEFQVLPVADPRIIGRVDYGWARFNAQRLAAGRGGFTKNNWRNGSSRVRILQAAHLMHEAAYVKKEQ
jgi:hypothetical protein